MQNAVHSEEGVTLALSIKGAGGTLGLIKKTDGFKTEVHAKKAVETRAEANAAKQHFDSLGGQVLTAYGMALIFDGK